MKYVYNFVRFINESAREALIVEGAEEVVFFPGRFQPFHKGHLAALKNAADTFGKKVVALQILSAREESPFPDSLLQIS